MIIYTRVLSSIVTLLFICQMKGPGSIPGGGSKKKEKIIRRRLVGRSNTNDAMLSPSLSIYF